MLFFVFGIFYSLIQAEQQIQSAEKILRERQRMQVSATSTNSSSDSVIPSCHVSKQTEALVGGSRETGSLYSLEREITAARARSALSFLTRVI